ncbi:MAG: hypothetical protein DI598_06040 [Pseudopedobacter saltans]|uniref:Uncharacterized protein n=1 Tax=Pseudopedobacter saltans TaxID=151895 RepID=A0A2W5GWK1_9SPHI|nr:MAG: hypothetical protein DI598_06040 [Pseudopedobacter saltans]
MAKVSLKYIRIILAVSLILIFSSKIYAIVQAKYIDKSSVSIEKDGDCDDKKDCDGKDDNLKAKLLGEELFVHSFITFVNPYSFELSNSYKVHLYPIFSSNFRRVITPPPDL